MAKLFNYFYSKVYEEGGNVSFGDKKAGEIDLGKISRKELSVKLKSFFIVINKTLKAWKESEIQSGHIFSGSSESFFNKNIQDEEFTKYKPKMGDVDVLYPNDKVESLRNFLKSSIGKTIAGFKIEATNTRATTNVGQFHMLLNYNEILIQVDFEFSDFKNGSPTIFSKVMRSSDWEDIKGGIKGKFTKILLSAIISSMDKQFKNIIIVGKNGKQRKIDSPEDLSRFALSVDRGLRTERYIPYAEKINGKKAYIEVDPSESKYNKSLPDIAYFMFKHKLNDSELSQLRSISGTVKLINKYIPQRKKEIVETFKRKMKDYDPKILDSILKILKDK